MHDLLKILGSIAVIVFLSWIISTAGPQKDKKTFKKMLFWMIVVPVVGTTVGTLVLLWLKSHGLI